MIKARPLESLLLVAGARSVVLRTDRGYSKGDEVYVSYGQKTSALLLLSYGFIPAPGACAVWLDRASDGLSSLRWGVTGCGVRFCLLGAQCCSTGCWQPAAMLNP